MARSKKQPQVAVAVTSTPAPVAPTGVTKAVADTLVSVQTGDNAVFTGWFIGTNDRVIAKAEATRDARRSSLLEGYLAAMS
jgi:hypothetical protein